VGSHLSAAREFAPTHIGSLHHRRTFFRPVTQRTSGSYGRKVCQAPSKSRPGVPSTA